MLVETHGSITLLRPECELDDDFIKTQLSPDNWQHFGGAIAVEPRCVPAILEGLIEYGCDYEHA
jgi:hypothetical protein